MAVGSPVLHRLPKVPLAIKDPEIAARERGSAEPDRPAGEAQEAERRRQVALAAAGLGTWHWDIRSDRGTRDAAFNRLLGLDPRPSVGPLRDFLDHVHPDDLGMVMEAFNRAVRTRRPYAVEHRVVWPDGSVRWLRDRGSILDGPDGEPAAFAGAAMDVTELR
ncbi:MAG TPA: PAS domain-containing protein, partial [Thermoanaerobaculia bacterium]|nr:PAS domain-containing protein [Thermoanaerobaculia bacterium]